MFKELFVRSGYELDYIYDWNVVEKTKTKDEVKADTPKNETSKDNTKPTDSNKDKKKWGKISKITQNITYFISIYTYI